MLSLLLVVVILTITTNLISTVGAPAINNLLWNLYTRFIPSPVQSVIPKAKALRSEVLQLRKELAGTSSQDEFAKWAKVRRTLDKKVAELETINATIQTSRTSFDSRAGMFRWVITVGFRMFLQFWFSRQPMFWIPQGWVPSVIEWGLSFPRAPMGSVSINVWSFAVGQIVALVLAAGMWAYQVACEVRGKMAPRVAQAGKKEL
ncbi:CHD5-like protein-domain-containing protein [Pyronema omphalodes]|nr:CHD5-like protein-domain-containing protein [Pyronema omphalodes]